MARKPARASAESLQLDRDCLDLQVRVACMRAFGVVGWGGILLGPAPVPGAGEPRKEPTLRETEEAAVKASRARVARALGATGLKLPEGMLDQIGKVLR